MAGTIEERLQQLGIEIPNAPEAVGAYVPVVRIGTQVVTSGQLPFVGRELVFTGKVGKDLTEEQGIAAARLCAINALSQIKAAVGSLENVRRIFRVEGYVQSAEGFVGQPQVLNGASHLIGELFQEAGQHTRIAVGANQLPLNAAVELVLWAEVAPTNPS